MSAQCRLCSAPLRSTFVDLGVQPFANAYLKPEALHRPETFYPLHAWVCDACLLVQLEAFESPETIFGDYAYFSSYSASWLRHAEQYATMARERFALTRDALVVEVASNDGYLLRNFTAAGIPVLGIEPARNVAAEAERNGIPTRAEFFGRALARRLVDEGVRADLLIGNNVLAHVPDLDDFVGGLAILLRPQGTLTMEFPHLMRLIEQGQFDTIYHEHFSYFSLLAAERAFAAHGLHLYDVEELSTHGGSLRVYVGHGVRPPSASLEALRRAEEAAGMHRLETYTGFGPTAARVKRDLLRFLVDARAAGRRVVGYGAPAKGNTLLNYCGVRTDLLDFTVDRSPHKQGCFLPGTRIPVLAPEAILEARPEYVLILPWNLRDEIAASMAGIRAWGGQFVVPVPRLEVF